MKSVTALVVVFNRDETRRVMLAVMSDKGLVRWSMRRADSTCALIKERMLFSPALAKWKGKSKREWIAKIEQFQCWEDSKMSINVDLNGTFHFVHSSSTLVKHWISPPHTCDVTVSLKTTRPEHKDNADAATWRERKKERTPLASPVLLFFLP